MDILQRNYPIPVQPTWDIHDATKLNTFKLCPRLYFFEYVLGWKEEAVNLHLEFGKAWHLAMRHLTINGCSSSSIAEAAAMFSNHYSEYFSTEHEEQNAPKNMANGIHALAEYGAQYPNDRFTVLFTEVPGSVPLAEGKTLHFKIDAVLRDEKGIFAMEHKTGSRDSAAWRAQWQTAMQPSLYTHALRCHYGDSVWGCMINGTLLRKKGNLHVRIPIRKSNEVMQTWMWNTINELEMLDWEFGRLSTCKISDPVMFAFPMREVNCTKWFPCPFLPYCTSPEWTNPLTKAEQPPSGFVVDHWNPMDKREGAEKTMDL